MNLQYSEIHCVPRTPDPVLLYKYRCFGRISSVYLQLLSFNHWRRRRQTSPKLYYLSTQQHCVK